MVNEMWKIDTGKETILAIMKPYQHAIISMMLESKTDGTTGQLHAALEDEGFIISRASVINYCKLLAENNIISYEEKTGKGGYHRVYTKLMNWESILEMIHMKVLEKMTSVFPGSNYLKDSIVLLNEYDLHG